MVFRLIHHLRTTLWPIPVLCVLIGIGISYLTVKLDNGNLVPSRWTGGPDAALAILATVAASMITLTGIVLTIVLVVVQLAMDQFSPRIVRAILHDRPSQFAIGIFVATFAHAMLAMRELVSLEEGAPVPGLAILVTFALVVVSIVVLVLYTNHIGQSLRVASLIETVGKDSRQLIDKMYPDKGDPVDSGQREIIAADRSGVVFKVDIGKLVDLAEQAKCTLLMIPTTGDFVPAGAPIFVVEGERSAIDHRKVRNAVALGPERTMNHDLAYGLRMLVDIAVRALSDAFDPTTAVQAIDRLHDVLRQLARRPFPSGEHRDSVGEVRLVTPQLTWEAYVRLAFTEIVDISETSVQVVGRLKSALNDLLTICPGERQGPLLDQLQRITESSSGARIEPDPQGIGSARNLIWPRIQLDGIDGSTATVKH
jgi:uncharacterized membrane protein